MKKILIIAALAALIAAYFVFDLGPYLTLRGSRIWSPMRKGITARIPVAVLAGFFAIYVAVTAASIPGAAIMTLGGGRAVRAGDGTILVSFASTHGRDAGVPVIALCAARHYRERALASG